MYLNPGIFRPKVKSIHSCILHGCLCQTQGETSVGFCQIDFLYAITTGPPEPAFFLHQPSFSTELLSPPAFSLQKPSVRVPSRLLVGSM